MKKITYILSAIILTGILTVTSFAATKDPKVNQRQDNQKSRISQGVKSGELTRAETAALTLNQAKIARDEHKAKADGQLTVKERIELNKDLNKSSERIYKAKHN